MKKILPESSQRDLAPTSQSSSLIFGHISFILSLSPRFNGRCKLSYRLLIAEILSSLSEVERRQGEESRVRDRTEQHNIIITQHNNLVSGTMHSDANKYRNRYNTYSDVNSVKNDRTQNSNVI